MSNLEIAHKWSKFGKVFPAYECDRWERSKLFARKTPATRNGHLDATQDPDRICQWWAFNPDRLVGLWLEDEVVVLDIDIDLETVEDGFERIRSEDLEVPKTFWQKTPSGGRHYFYRANPLKPLGPWNNYLKKHSGDRSGVDRKSGSSYVIAYASEPPLRNLLADVPVWLTRTRANPRLNEYTGTVQSWLASLVEGIPDWAVFDAISRFPETDFDHQVMISCQVELVRLGAENHSGVEEALELLSALWTFGPYDTQECRQDWIRALEGAVRKFGGSRTLGASK